MISFFLFLIVVFLMLLIVYKLLVDMPDLKEYTPQARRARKRQEEEVRIKAEEEAARKLRNEFKARQYADLEYAEFLLAKAEKRRYVAQHRERIVALVGSDKARTLFNDIAARGDRDWYRTYEEHVREGLQHGLFEVNTVRETLKL